MVSLTWSTDPNPARPDQIAPFLKAHPNIRIKIEPNTRDKIIVQSASRVGPDIIEIYSLTDMVQFVEAGILLDLTEFASKMGFSPDVTFPRLRGNLLHNGRQYRFPCNIGNQDLRYNKRLFREAGIPEPQSAMLWEDFIERVKPLTVKRPDGAGYERFAMLMARGNARDIHLQRGARFFTPDGTRSALDSPESIAAVQFYYDLMTKHHVIPTPDQSKALSGGGGWATGEINFFMNERSACLWGARWMMVQFRGEPHLEGNIGAVLLPRFPGGEPANYCGTRGSGINVNTPHREEALQFLAYLASEEYNRIIAQSSDGLPPNARFCENPEFLVNPKYPAEDAAMQEVFIRSMDYAETPEISPFVDPVVAESYWNDALDYVENGMKTPEEAMREAAKRVNDRIQATLRERPDLKALYEERLARRAPAAPQNAP